MTQLHLRLLTIKRWSHLPRHVVLSWLMVHPTLQIAHFAAPFAGQPAPVSGIPLWQMQMLATIKKKKTGGSLGTLLQKTCFYSAMLELNAYTNKYTLFCVTYSSTWFRSATDPALEDVIIVHLSMVSITVVPIYSDDIAVNSRDVRTVQLPSCFVSGYYCVSSMTSALSRFSLHCVCNMPNTKWTLLLVGKAFDSPFKDQHVAAFLYTVLLLICLKCASPSLQVTVMKSPSICAMYALYKFPFPW